MNMSVSHRLRMMVFVNAGLYLVTFVIPPGSGFPHWLPVAVSASAVAIELLALQAACAEENAEEEQ